MFNQLKTAINTKLDKWFPPIPQPAPRRPKTAPSGPQRPKAKPQPATPTITYEQWLRGEGKAPRGMGKEWQARRNCERAIMRMKRFSNSNRYQSRYQAGSYNYRRAAGAHGDRRHIWNECIETAEAVYHAEGEGVFWVSKWDIIKDIMTYPTAMFAAYGL